jgi:hypothetical protein
LGHDAFGCIPPVGPKDINTSCYVNADCKTGYCWDYAGYGRRCVAPTCSSAACGQVTLFDGFGQFQVTLVGNNARTASGDRLTACNGGKQAEGDLAVGRPCTLSTDCRSDRCSTTWRGCTDVCCVDADCGDPGWVCRPIALQDTQNRQFMGLRCVPRNR